MSGRWFWPAGTLRAGTAPADAASGRGGDPAERSAGGDQPRNASTDGGDLAVRVDSQLPGWQYTGLDVARLADGDGREWQLTGREALVVPLHGSFQVRAGTGDDVHEVTLAGRPNVFDAPTDVAFAPAGSALRVTAIGQGAVAVCTAQTLAGSRHPFRHILADQVPQELRGAGNCSRLVRNLGTPEVLDAERLLVCEVITPGGNWSSYPPHKHDSYEPGKESVLEEIYYFRTRSDPRAPGASDPVGYQRVYASDDRPIDVLAEVRDDDVVLVPYGWHGPATTPPGCELYYLNVMAGPGPERRWLICDDPDYAFVRPMWADVPVDPRLTERAAPAPRQETR